MNFDLAQTSFAGGEFSPSLFGRTDIAQYANACKMAENFIIRPYGPAISAPGTRYVATVSDSSLRARLIKFVFNRDDAYVIEMGDRYLRFFTNRGQVTQVSSSEDLSAYTANLVAQYKMNENAADTTFTDNTAAHSGTTSTNTSTLHATGKVGTGSFNFASLYWAGADDSNGFTFSDRTSGANPFSFVLWAYNTGSGLSRVMISKYDSAPEYILQINTSNHVKMSLYDGAQFASIESNDVLPVGWNHIAFTYSGVGGASASAGMNLYVNGSILSSVSRVDSGSYVGMTNGSDRFLVGAFRTGGTYSSHFDDKLDNVAVLNKQLSAAEVLNLYDPLTTESAYQISSVYSEADLDNIQYSQLNDIIWLSHKDKPPQQLVRSAATSWAISNFAFKGGPFLDDNLTATTITPSATAGTINLTVSPTTANLFTVSASTLGHVNSYWKIGGLAQTSATTGLQEEGYVQITYVTNSYTATATVIKNLKATTATTDWAEGAWSAVRGYPACVTFHERRLWFARTNYEPQKAWASKVFKYDDFALDTEADDDALNLALASNESNEIQWISSSKSLIAGSYGGNFIVGSGSAELTTPNNVSASNQINVGCARIQPKKIGQLLYYVQRFATKLRELFYSFAEDSYKSPDKTVLSPHILGDGVIDMDVQQTPDPILYCVRTDGTLALFTREVDQEVQAWSRLTTDGTYTSIAIIPSQVYDYDEAWVTVERWINGSRKRYVELFENLTVPARQDKCLYLHSALTYDAYEQTSLSSTTISLSNTAGSITVTSSTSFFAAGSVNKRIRMIDDDGVTLGEGLVTAYTSGTSVTVSVTTVFTSLSSSAGYWGLSVSSVSGLSHLEAKTVGILADGNTESLTRTVASGVVTLGSNYFVINVGLSYNQIIATLPKEGGSARGTANAKFQRVHEIAFKVNRSTQDFQYGQDANNLDYVNQSFTPTVTSLYTGIIPPETGGIAMRGGYARGASVYIKNSTPLPIELLSIVFSIETSDK